MCGIAGFTIGKDSPNVSENIKNMVHSIRHRGPDAQATFFNDHIALGHARLSIIDLSEAGTQPMHSEDGQYSIVFNGEIFNYLELKKELQERGYQFKTKTDTEVILALFIFDGTASVNRLNGMFSIAFWDNRAKTLDLFRDRIGKKPLYYSLIDGQFYFASELKALMPIPGFKKDIAEDAVYDFFAYQYIPDPKTIFKGCFKLAPGCHLHFSANAKISIIRYWKPDFTQTEALSFNQAKETLLEKIQQATHRRLISDVPLGAFLSGGVDSSGVVALMAKKIDQVTTCCIGFDDKKFNETEFAQIVADKYNTQHHVHTVHSNIASRLNNITYFFDEPFADPSLVPTFFVSELARKNVTVALTGDGGDEVFAGYSKYTTDWHENRLRQKFPSFSRKAMGTLAPYLRNIPFTAVRKASSLMNSLSLDPAKAFYVTNSFLDEHVWQAIIKDDLRQNLKDYHPSTTTEDYYHASNATDHLGKILDTDMNTYLPGGVLVKADRMSMANALELRAPLLDFNVIEFANSIQSDFKFNNGEKKYILKETFKPFLPDDILYRKKMGFSTPLALWFRTELKDLTEQTLFTSRSGIERFFNRSAIQTLWDDHQQKRFDHSAILWSLLMFEMWWQHYMTDDNTDVNFNKSAA